MKFCRFCGGSEKEGHRDLPPEEPGGYGSWCPVLMAEMDPTVTQFTQSSLRPPMPSADNRQGVIHHAAGSAITYTTESRRRAPVLAIPPRLLKPNQGTMTREEYLAWRDAS